MAKKHFGRLLTLAAVVGAAAAGISYFLQYKSFHKELDEDFHDFEDDFDDFDDTEKAGGTETRTYVTLNPEAKPAETAADEAKCPCAASKEAAAPADRTAAETPAAEVPAADEQAENVPAEKTAPTADDTEKEASPIPETTVTVEEATE